MINVDEFATISDRYGNMNGDQVLRQVALRLENILREDDVLARTGGDTFTLAMVEATVEDAVEIAERCRLAVASEPVVTSVGAIRVTISLGIAASPPGHGHPPQSPRDGWGTGEELLGEAMERLHEAKRVGRNRTVC
jgi:diguanylate cyclase (GGDEF)-like protein